MYKSFKHVLVILHAKPNAKSYNAQASESHLIIQRCRDLSLYYTDDYKGEEEKGKVCKLKWEDDELSWKMIEH